MKYDLVELKRRLLEIRESKKSKEPDKWSRQYVSKKTGIKIRTLQYYENTQNPSAPDTEKLLKLCDLYDCDLDYLFGNLDYSRHALDPVCSYTGLSEAAAKNLHNMNNSTKQLLNWILTGSDLLNHIEQYVSIDNAVNLGDLPSNIKILGVNVTRPVLKQATLNHIRDDLDLCDAVLTFDWNDSVNDDMETTFPLTDR